MTAEMVAEIKTEVETHVLSEKKSSRDLARATLYTQIKEKLVEAAPNALRSFSIEDGKWEDGIRIIGEAIKTAAKAGGHQQQQEQEQETPEQIRSRLESENKKTLDDERKKIRKEGAVAKLVAAAVAEGLDPKYEKLFVAAFSEGYEFDVTKDEVSIRKADEPYYISGKPATNTDVVKELFSTYTAFKKATVKTPDPNKPAGGAPAKPAGGGEGGGGEGALKTTWEEDLMAEMPGYKQFAQGQQQQQS